MSVLKTQAAPVSAADKVFCEGAGPHCAGLARLELRRSNNWEWIKIASSTDFTTQKEDAR